MDTLKLSLNIILEELEKLFSVSARLDEDCCCILDVRVCDSMDTVSYFPEYIYLLQTPEEPESSEIFHKNGQIHVCATLPKTINAVLSIFQRYKQHEQALRLALTKENPFQAIAETANQILDFPICISNNIFRTIGLAGDRATEQIRYLDLNHQTSPAYLDFILKPQRFTKYMSGQTPWQIKLPEDCVCESILRVNCFFNGEVRCRIVIMPPAAVHSLALTQISEYIAHVIEAIPLSKAEPFFSASLSSDSVVSEDGQPSPGTFLYRTASDYVSERPFYVCRITSARNNAHNFSAVWIKKKLETINVQLPAYIYHNDVILLLKHSRNHPDSDFEQLTKILEEIHFSCYISNLCRCIPDISVCIRQTCRLAELHPASAGEFVYYEDHAADCLIKEITSQMNLEAWLYKGFPMLEKKDSEEHSAYYPTLCTLSRHHFIHQDAAAELFLHRNSFKYRINKIEDFLSCDLSDEDLQFFIRLSYLMKNS